MTNKRPPINGIFKSITTINKPTGTVTHDILRLFLYQEITISPITIGNKINPTDIKNSHVNKNARLNQTLNKEKTVSTIINGSNIRVNKPTAPALRGCF